MRLNKSTSYSVRILIDCAKAGDRLIKVADIAKRLDITQQNAFKIVHLLSKAGFLTSVRGRHGGVRLARPPRAIKVGDVVRAIEFAGQDGKERAGGASLGQIVDDAFDAFISVLDQHTLEEMADATRPLPDVSDAGGQGGRSRKSSLKAPPVASPRLRRGASQVLTR